MLDLAKAGSRESGRINQKHAVSGPALIDYCQQQKKTSIS